MSIYEDKAASIYERGSVYNEGGVYDVVKDNLVKNLGGFSSNSKKNSNNNISYIVGGAESYQIYNIVEPINVGEKVTISFEVTDCNATRLKSWHVSAENISSTLIEFKGVGFYSKTFTCVSRHSSNIVLVFYSNNSTSAWDETDKYCIIKNFKVERNIHDTEYNVAPSEVDNRVKIGKHYYHTCTIGNQQWLSENLNEDLKGVVDKDVDWQPYMAEDSYIFLGMEIGNSVSLTPVKNSASYNWCCISINVEYGETIKCLGLSGYSSTAVRFGFLDSNNVLISKISSVQSVVVPENAKKLVINSYYKNNIIYVIQSTHTSEGTWEGYYNNDPSYGVKGYGKLYTWDCICSANETPSSAMAALLKDGWRVPTKADFDTLLATSDITSAKIKEKWYWTTPGTNELGFSAVSSGYKKDYTFNTGEFQSWSSTTKSDSSSGSQAHTLRIGLNGMTTDYWTKNNTSCAVRLVRDLPAVAELTALDGDVSLVSNS